MYRLLRSTAVHSCIVSTLGRKNEMDGRELRRELASRRTENQQLICHSSQLPLCCTSSVPACGSPLPDPVAVHDNAPAPMVEGVLMDASDGPRRSAIAGAAEALSAPVCRDLGLRFFCWSWVVVVVVP